VKARIIDNADSPYAAAIASAKAIQRGIDNGDVPSIRAMAQRLRSSVGAAPAQVATGQVASTTTPRSAGTAIDVVAPTQPQPQPAVLDDLQSIEDLLTGSEQERREGMDRLHQLIRRLRQ
jgi:hypothetical protein